MIHSDPGFTISAINRLGERLRKGSRQRLDFEMLSHYREAFEDATGAVVDSIRRMLFCESIMASRSSKSTISVIAKLTRERSRLSQMQDIGGVRVIVAKVSQQNRFIGLISDHYPGSRVVDRRASPRAGYRGVHVIVSQNGRFIEVQVRTRLQNAWAQFSEKLADQFGEEVKYGGGPSSVRKVLDGHSQWITEVETFEVRMDHEKTVINPLLRRQRLGPPLTVAEKARVKEYQRLQAHKRRVRVSGFVELEKRAAVRGGTK